MNNITERQITNPTPPRLDQTIAEDIADFFINKIKKIRDDLATCPTYSPAPRETPELKAFTPMTQEQAVKII